MLFPQIEFTRSTRYRHVARFTWTRPQKVTSVAGSLPSSAPVQIDVVVEFPAVISGNVLVSNSYVEFQFDPGKGPKYQFNYNKKLLFDDEVRCLNATRPFATVCPRNLGSDVPYLPIEVTP